MMRTVTAVARREGNWWAVEVPEVDGLFTQARRLDQIPAMVSDAAELLIGEPVQVGVQPVLDAAVLKAVMGVKEKNAAAEQVQREAAESARALVASLRSSGLTVRDVGVVLGISPQRVSQLAS